MVQVRGLDDTDMESFTYRESAKDVELTQTESRGVANAGRNLPLHPKMRKYRGLLYFIAGVITASILLMQTPRWEEGGEVATYTATNFSAHPRGECNGDTNVVCRLRSESEGTLLWGVGKNLTVTLQLFRNVSKPMYELDCVPRNCDWHGRRLSPARKM